MKCALKKRRGEAEKNQYTKVVELSLLVVVVVLLMARSFNRQVASTTLLQIWVGRPHWFVSFGLFSVFNNPLFFVMSKLPHSRLVYFSCRSSAPSYLADRFVCLTFLCMLCMYGGIRIWKFRLQIYGTNGALWIAIWRTKHYYHHKY